MDIFDKLHNGEIYDPAHPALLKEQLSCLKKLDEYNALPLTDIEKPQRFIKRNVCGNR